MSNRDLLNVLDSYDVTKMEVLLNQDERGVRFLGFMRKYQFIESQNTLSLFFTDTRLHPLFDSLFSNYLVSDINVTGVAPNFILLNNTCRESNTKIKSGILESLTISEPLLERIDREALTSRSITYQPEPIQENELSSENLNILHSAWQSISEAKI